MDDTRIKKYKEYRENLQYVETSLKIEENNSITSTIRIDEMLKNSDVKKDELELVTKKLKTKYTKLTILICSLVALFFILIIVGILIWRK